MARKFFYESIPRYIITCMNLWKDLQVKVQNNYINVPLIYGNFPKYEKARKYIEEKGKNYLSGYTATPIVSFILNSLSYNEQRQPINKYNHNLLYSNNASMYIKNRIPMPFDFSFNMKVWARNLNQISQLAEQILPYIAVPFSLRLLEFPGVEDIKRDVMLYSTDTTFDLNYEDDSEKTESEYKALLLSIDLVLQGFLYFPFSEDDTRIQDIFVNYQNSNENFGTQFSNSLGEYIDYLEKQKIKAQEEDGAFIMKKDDNTKVINDYQKPSEKE